MRRAGLILGLAWLLLTPAWAQDIAVDFDRSDLANTDLPIWSELNPFETWAIRQAPYARAGNADALLAHYLLASGDRSSMRDYDAYRGRMDSWISGLKLSGDPKRRERNARKLYLGMHKEFFGKAMSADATPLNYREEQSQLSRVFETGEFNCISSALLYTVAARKIGLDAEGVILPSHAFVQLRFNSEVVEVETTSLNGFGLEHNENFYAGASEDWFSERGLSPPSYAQYQQRDIVSPYQLGLFNMVNQHISRDRMDYADRMRLAEIRGHLMPRDEEARKSRLHYYYQEYFQFQESGDFTTAMRMYDQIGDYLAGLEDQPVADPELPVLLTTVQAQMAETLSQVGRQQESLALARQLLQDRDFGGQASMVKSHLFSLISNYAVNRAEHKDYLGARVAFDALENQCLENKLCNSGLAQVYSSWAMHYIEDKDWERGADIYREYLLLDDSSDLSRHFSDNLERVYLNWAAGEEWRGEWEVAMAVLNECTQMLTTALRCESEMQKLDARHDAGYL